MVIFDKHMSQNSQIMVHIFNILILLLSHGIIQVSCDSSSPNVADSSIEILDNQRLRIPKIKVDEFIELTKENANLNNFHLVKDGEKVSAFAITDIGDDYKVALEAFYDEAPNCISNNDDANRANNLYIPKEIKLPDGSTRRTFATEFKEYPNCLSTISTISKVFDEIEKRVSTLLNRLNNNQELTYIPKLESNPISLYDAPIKDHIHVYTKGKSSYRENDEHEYLVPFHVDNGIYLLLTPFPNHGLEVKLSNGHKVSTSNVDSESILVLMGRGLTDWLLQQNSNKNLFYPTPHAVPPLSSGDILKRSVYARMKVAPAKAIPLTRGEHRNKSLKTFEDVFMEEFTRDTSTTQGHDLCSVDLKGKSDRVHRASNDTWSDAHKAMCDEGQAYCWMSCRPLPSECPSVEHARCYSSDKNISCGTTPGAKPMDKSCKWECKEHDGGHDHKDLKNEFCNGATDMYMSGFEAAGVDKRNPCVILFISAWTLDSKLKFVFACFGVAFMGFLIEFLICVRRRLSSRKRLSPYLLAPRPSFRQWISISLFGVNLFLGYLAMLVAMTYSIELFICVIVGLMVGHACFNSKASVGETVDPCCAPSQNPICPGGGNCLMGIGTPEDRMPITRTPCDKVDVEAPSSAEEAPLAASPNVLNHVGSSALSLPKMSQNHSSFSSPGSTTSSKKCCSKLNNTSKTMLNHSSTTNIEDTDSGSTNYGERETILERT